MWVLALGGSASELLAVSSLARSEFLSMDGSREGAFLASEPGAGELGQRVPHKQQKGDITESGTEDLNFSAWFPSNQVFTIPGRAEQSSPSGAASHGLASGGRVQMGECTNAACPELLPGGKQQIGVPGQGSLDYIHYEFEVQSSDNSQ